MLTRDLLVDAAVACTRAGFGSQTLIQRKVRVGFGTAGQLLFALCDLGFLAETRIAGRRAAILGSADRGPIEAKVDAGITSGLVQLTPTGEEATT